MAFLNKLIALALPYVPKSIVRKVSERYIAGATLDDAMQTVKNLNAKGAMATVDVLGEFIDNLEQAAINTEYSCEVLRRSAREGLQGNLSVKLTSLGMEIDVEKCEANVRKILDVAKENGNMFVRIDMENSPYTEKTIDLYRRLRKEYHNVGVVLQAYLRRTPKDIDMLLREGHEIGVKTNIRLCKGIYVEPETIAYKGRDEIRKNYHDSLDKLLNGHAYVGIATHDDVLIEDAKALVKQYKLQHDEYEFQMLLGVRESVRDVLIREGHCMRIYVPFGEDWYGYSIRRLKENPQMGGYVVKALFTGK